MSFQASWKWLKVISILICLLYLWPPLITDAHHNSLEHPWKLLQEHRHNILHLSSDPEALKFNQTFMPQPRQPQHSPTRRKSSRDRQSAKPIPQEIQRAITSFWAAMVTIVAVQEFRAVPEASFPTHLFTEILPSEAQRQWLFSKSSLQGFKDLVEFQKKMSAWPKQEPVALSPHNNLSQFEKLDYQIDLTSSRQTWISLFNELGFTGIQAKLGEYWQKHDEQDLPLPASNSLKQSYIQHYIEFRLFPIFHIHLLTQAIQVEAQVYNVAWESWNHIQQWQQQEHTHLAMGRLCGTWKWIIHNHQNHGDHKTTMTFSTPGKSTPAQVQPSTILIHGNTVYLKWTFPQGIQEDSLLLTNRDTRLEGTFTNSLGPHGSISGQRLSPCQD
jgi:hypothetical protein